MPSRPCAYRGGDRRSERLGNRVSSSSLSLYHRHLNKDSLRPKLCPCLSCGRRSGGLAGPSGDIDVLHSHGSVNKITDRWRSARVLAIFLPITFEPDAAFAATQHALTHAVSERAIGVESDRIDIGQLRTIEGPAMAEHEALRVISLGSDHDLNNITHKGNPRMTDTENVKDTLKSGGNKTARHPLGCEDAGHGANWPASVSASRFLARGRSLQT